MTGDNWHPIDPLDGAVERKIGHDLAALDAVHRSWQEHRTELGQLEKPYPLHQTLRKTRYRNGCHRGVVRHRPGHCRRDGHQRAHPRGRCRRR